MSKLPPLNTETIWGILNEAIDDDTVNKLLWHHLGYRYDSTTAQWDISGVSPEWKEAYPEPPNFIESRPATVKLTRSIPPANKQLLKEQLGFKGYKVGEFGPQQTRRATAANWLLSYMQMNQQREFPNWEQLYQDKAVESMAWFNPNLDPDIEQALTKLNLHTGTILDLGTGPGTQAMALAEHGFKVTATDLSTTAIEKAKAIAKAKGLDISWQQDDILNSNLDQEFDFVFDRGCFHVLPPERRPDYVSVVANLIKPSGYLFLKCFSHLETRKDGPYRFTPEEIQDIFSRQFNIISVEDTVYQGTLEQLPRALFCILHKF